MCLFTETQPSVSSFHSVASLQTNQPKEWQLLTTMHLSPALSQNLTYEIILTLGQAFEVAYQLALQAQRTKQHHSVPAGPGSEVIDTTSSRPVPKPRGSVRKSGVSPPNHRTENINVCYVSVLCGKTSRIILKRNQNLHVLDESQI